MNDDIYWQTICIVELVNDISSLDICTIDSNSTGGYDLLFTAVFMRAVLLMVW